LEKVLRQSIALWLVVAGTTLSSTNAAIGQRHGFNVSDDIGLTHFGDLYGGDTKAVTPSPSGKLVAIQSERGSLQDNRLHDELRIYDMDQLRRFVNSSGEPSVPEPIWTIHEATNKDGGDHGCLITNIRWLADSSALAFLLRNEAGRNQLLLADTHERQVAPLTPFSQDVTSFQIRDREHYVFAVATVESTAVPKNDTAAVVVEADQTLYDVAFPEKMRLTGDRSELWAAVDGPPAPVVDPKTGRVIALYPEGTSNMVLSPDGESLLTILAVGDIPKEWATNYPPSYPGFESLIKPGHQDLTAPDGVFYVSQYVSVALKSGSVMSLTGAPTAIRAGWWANDAGPAWSGDGKEVVLPGTFVSGQSGPDARPCVAVLDIFRSSALQCLEKLKRNLGMGYEPGYKRIVTTAFAHGKNDEIVETYRDPDNSNEGFRTFVRDASGTWKLRSDQAVAPFQQPFIVEVKMSFDDPPKLVARDTSTGQMRMIWDPNPQLKDIELGTPSLYHWRDSTGREWSGILYKPSHYVSGQRYPLVIQNHGFSEQRFSPSGGFPSAFAAQELASAGIMVLHIRDCAGRGTPMEGPCNVMGYEAAVTQLSREGLVDPENVGIIGFSKTVFYVMEALTTSTVHFKAASITDGVDIGYFLQILDSGAEAWTASYSALIGGPAFGPGLRKWLERSPEFNMDKVTTPLRVVARGELGSLSMWEPYALLREMHKPVEFVRLDTNEHVMTNPAVRLAAQGGNVDWFRFWLKGYEDPESTKLDQYKRWEALREVQKESNYQK
jgi:dipeptidyl aminopeptidase/acylaminoacyl peptidase